MRDEARTQEELISELIQLRRRITELEKSVCKRKQTEEELRKKREEIPGNLRTGSTGYGLGGFTPIGQYMQANPRYCQIGGRTKEEMTELNCLRITHPDDIQEGLENLERMIKGKCGFFNRTKRYVRPDESIVWTSLTAVPIWGEAETPDFHISMIEDITERKRAEKERESAWALLEAAITQSPSGIIIADAPNVTVRLANPAAYRIRGETMEPLTGIDFREHSIRWQTFRPDGTPYPSERLPLSRAILKGEITQNEEVIIRHESGEDRWVFVNAAPILNNEGGIAAGVVVFHDITERKRMETELLKSRDELELRVRERTAELERLNDELRSISSRLISWLQEEERKRLANELHDSIGQTLAALKFGIETVLIRKDRGDTAGAFKLLEGFVPTLQRSIEETRAIYMGIRPSILDNLGLLATLEWFCRDYQSLHPRHHVELETKIEEGEIPEALKIAVFRIVQEALNNVAKYSQAERVDVEFARAGDRIELIITDDGNGFDLDSILSNSVGTSLGLTAMRERAELTDGNLSIESTLGKGTTIRAFWPMESESSAKSTRYGSRGGISTPS